MKVVINKCFGGFGLSDEAVYRLYKKSSPLITVKPINDYYGNSPNKFEEDKVKYYIPFKGGLLKHRIMSNLVDGDKMIYYSDYEDRMNNRKHPDMIWIVETMGKAAGGEYAELEIIVIPDGVEFEIDEYDGMESIHEKHRSWA